MVYNSSYSTERKSRNLSESSCGESWDEVVGVMSIDIPLDQVRERLALPVDRSLYDRFNESFHSRFKNVSLGLELREKLGAHAHAFLIDRNGYLLAHPLVDHSVHPYRMVHGYLSLHVLYSVQYNIVFIQYSTDQIS